MAKKKKCAIKKKIAFLFVELFLRMFSACLLQRYFRPFNSGSFDVPTDNLLLAVWKLATLKAMTL